MFEVVIKVRNLLYHLILQFMCDNSYSTYQHLVHSQTQQYQYWTQRLQYLTPSICAPVCLCPNQRPVIL